MDYPILSCRRHPQLNSAREEHLSTEPTRSELLLLAKQLLVEGNYTGFGLSKEQRLGERVCDILYLKKHPTQVDFEKRHQAYVSQLVDHVIHKTEKRALFWKEIDGWDYLSNCLSYLCNWPSDINVISNRIESQCISIKNLTPILNEKIKAWNYESYSVCSSKELRDLGVQEKDLFDQNMIVLYHKEN